jgi:hypothetical protein
MSYFQDLHAAHVARTRRLSRGMPARKAQPVPVEIAAPEPEPVEAAPDPKPALTREDRLDALQKEAAAIAAAGTPQIPIYLIVRTVAVFYGVHLNDIYSQCREQRVVRPRQIAAYIAKVLTRGTLNEIGRRIGRKDHTTIMHACRKIADLRMFDATLDADIDELMARLCPSYRRPDYEQQIFIPAFLPKRAA